MKFIFICISFLISITASADFFIVQRNGNLRAEPSTSSEIVERIHTGDTLLLVDDFKTDNYWHVRSVASGQEGWVYTTLVKRFSGEIDAFFEDDSENKVVDIRILDVGAGHCALIKLPGDKYIIYDAGSDAKLNGKRTLEQIKEYIPTTATIELMVLSHTDADHINAAGLVIRDYKIKKVLWTGYEASMAGGTIVSSPKVRPA